MKLIHQICTALIDRLAGVVEGLVGAAVTVQKGGAAAEPRQWVIAIRVEGALRGSCQIAIGHDAADALTGVITGIEGNIPPAAIVDALKEMTRQAINAEMKLLDDAGVQLTLQDVVLRESELPDVPVAGGILTGSSLTRPVALRMHASVVAADTATPVSDGTHAGDTEGTAGASGSRIDVILDIDLPVTVRFGHTDMPIRNLTRLGLGSVIDLGRSPDDPVDVLVGDRVVARGEVVIVGGNYGVRILDVVTPSERLRTMEA